MFEHGPTIAQTIVQVITDFACAMHTHNLARPHRVLCKFDTCETIHQPRHRSKNFSARPMSQATVNPMHESIATPAINWSVAIRLPAIRI